MPKKGLLLEIDFEKWTIKRKPAREVIVSN